ncbi:MAG: cell division protein FtsL [Pseudomonadales bacterium]|nr:cell division protein FtsL [Pseudomonadales bacterium]
MLVFWLKSQLATLILWLTVLLSALTLVLVSHLSRAEFMLSQSQIKEMRELEIDWGRLLLEKSSSSSVDQIEEQAVRQLAMKKPDADRMIVLKGAQ